MERDISIALVKFFTMAHSMSIPAPLSSPRSQSLTMFKALHYYLLSTSKSDVHNEAFWRVRVPRG